MQRVRDRDTRWSAVERWVSGDEGKEPRLRADEVDGSMTLSNFLSLEPGWERSGLLGAFSPLKAGEGEWSELGWK